MKRFLKLISGIILAGVLFSCSSQKGTCAKIPEIITLTNEATSKFNLQLDFRKNHFSGMLIARRMPGDEIRLVFTTHFGLSVFDFSLYPDSMAVNSCMEPMQRKKLVALLEKDLRLFFLPTTNTRIKEKNSIFEKRKSGRGITRAVVSLSEFTDSGPQRVHIRHPWIKLSLQLDKLDVPGK